ncbi:50S ribosomal protein L29 [Candidatus Daviesbacteria bacterium]|nr:50S ribosomal protein L29 [Candidatus Daviesbacteria bacterium]
MKKKDLVQIKGLDIRELNTKAKALQKEIADLVMDKNMDKLKDLKTISKKRKDLAQILTVLRQKELLNQLEVKKEAK